MTDGMKLKIHEKLKILKFFKTANFKTVGAACCRLFQLSLFLQNQGSNIIILFLSFFIVLTATFRSGTKCTLGIFILEKFRIRLNSLFGLDKLIKLYTCRIS